MARDTSSPWTGFPRPKHSLLEGRQDDAGKNCGHQATKFEYQGFTVYAMIVSHMHLHTLASINKPVIRKLLRYDSELYN